MLEGDDLNAKLGVMKVSEARKPKALEQSQLLFHTLLLLFQKSIGRNQLTTFVVDYDIINYRYSA